MAQSITWHRDVRGLETSEILRNRTVALRSVFSADFSRIVSRRFFFSSTLADGNSRLLVIDTSVYDVEFKCYVCSPDVGCAVPNSAQDGRCTCHRELHTVTEAATVTHKEPHTVIGADTVTHREPHTVTGVATVKHGEPYPVTGAATAPVSRSDTLRAPYSYGSSYGDTSRAPSGYRGRYSDTLKASYTDTATWGATVTPRPYYV